MEKQKKSYNKEKKAFFATGITGRFFVNGISSITVIGKAFEKSRLIV